MAFQSDTTIPVKPSSPLSSVVSRYLWPWSFFPFQLLKLAITVPAPALIVDRYPGRCTARSVASSTTVSPWSLPPVVPPSPT